MASITHRSSLVRPQSLHREEWKIYQASEKSTTHPRRGRGRAFDSNEPPAAPILSSATMHVTSRMVHKCELATISRFHLISVQIQSKSSEIQVQFTGIQNHAEAHLMSNITNQKWLLSLPQTLHFNTQLLIFTFWPYSLYL